MYNNVNLKRLVNIKHQELLKYLLTSFVAMDKLSKHIMKISIDKYYIFVYNFFFFLNLIMNASKDFHLIPPQKMLVFSSCA